jgi:hypothetical protein
MGGSYMFEIEFKVSNSTAGVYGKQLKEVMDKFHGETRETCWLHIHDIPLDQNTNYLTSPTYHNYCVDNLCQPNDSKRTVGVVRNYNEQGIQPADLLLTVLRQFEKLIFSSDDRLYILFDKYILPEIDVRFLGNFGSIFNKYAVKSSFSEPAKNKHRSSSEPKININIRLRSELLKLIELYCKHVGSLVIDVGNIGSISPDDKLFFANLMREIPRKLCLVTTSCEKEDLSFPGVNIIKESVSGVVKDIMKKLIRESFNLTRANEREMRKLVLNEYHASSIEDAAVIIKNIVELCNASASMPMRNYSQIANVDFYEIKKHYLLPSAHEGANRVNHTVETTVLTIEEMRIRYLCSILGPYIKLSDLEQIYVYFFEETYPSEINYSKLALMNNDGLIRYTSLSAYDKARQEQGIYKQLVQAALKKKIRHGVIECGALKRHIEALYARRSQLPGVMGLRIHEAILFLYGLDIHQSVSDLEHGLSGSSERAPAIVRKSSDLNSKTQEIIIFSCFDELIDFYYQKDMLKTFDYYRIFTIFVDDFGIDRYAIGDLELARMISLKKNKRKKDNPLDDLHPTIRAHTISILVNVMVAAYFLKRYWPIRRHIYQVYLCQSEDSSYRALIEAGVGLIVTQAAENQFKTYIDNELDNPISNPTLPNQDLGSYRQLQASASALALSADSKLGPSSSEYAITACMIYAVSAGKSIRYDVSAERLLAAYTRAMEQKDYTKAVLALGNAILLYYCAGGLSASFKEKCKECIALCDKYNPYPKPIIQGFLNFANYMDGSVSSTESFNLEIQTAEPNHFFINFTTLLILFYKGDYAACVSFCEEMRQLELQGGEDNTRVGYCIWRSFEIIEAVVLLRYLENNLEQITAPRIRQLRYTLKAYEIFAMEFPPNFDYRHKFLLAEASRSKLSKEITGSDAQSLDVQEAHYEEALDFALRRGNLYYSTEINKVLRQIRNKKTAAIQPSDVPQQSTSTSAIAVASNTDAAKKTYDELVTELVRRTGSNVVVLFIYSEDKRSMLPKLVFCHNEIVNDVTPAFTGVVFPIGNPPESVAWDHPVVQRSVKDRKLIFYRAEDCLRSPFLQAEGIKTMMAIPIMKPDSTAKVNKIVAVLYFQSKVLRDYNNGQLQAYNKFAHAFFNTVDADTAVLAFVRINNQVGGSSRSMGTSRSANTSKSSNSARTASASGSSTRPSSPSFFQSTQKPSGSATSSDEKSSVSLPIGTTDDDLDREDASEHKGGRPKIVRRSRGRMFSGGIINVPVDTLKDSLVAPDDSKINVNTSSSKGHT